MANKSYIERLRDPRWQRKRLEVMQRANFSCEFCGSGEKTLNVHHKLYRRGADPWDYADAELTCLCEDCHSHETDIRTRLDEALAVLDGQSIQEVVGFAEGLALLCRIATDPEIKLIIPSIGHATGVARSARTDHGDVDNLFNYCESVGGYYEITAATLFRFVRESIDARSGSKESA